MDSEINEAWQNQLIYNYTDYILTEKFQKVIEKILQLVGHVKAHLFEK